MNFCLISWNGTWISDKYFSYLHTNNSIWFYNCDILKEELLLKTEDSIDHAFVSPTTKYILIPIKKEKVKQKDKNHFTVFFSSLN